MLCEDFKFDMVQYLKIINWPDEKCWDIAKREGIIKMKEYFYSLRAKNPKTVLFTENQMNNLGYKYLRENKIVDAIEAFKLNVEIFPESFNVYDSLGEAYLKNGDYTLALLNYNKALELFPENKYAQRMVKEIKTKI